MKQIGILLIGFYLMACDTTQTKSVDNKMMIDEKNISNTEVIEMLIAAETVDCVGVMPQKCMQVKEGKALNNPLSEWQYFYDEIDGFDFITGYEYRIKVKAHRLIEVPADASSIRYELIEVLSKEQKTSVEKTTDSVVLYMSLPLLTVTDKEYGKDGYMTSLEDQDGGKYTMIVSIPNLEDKYVELEVGDKVKVLGEYAESFPVQIFAKEIKIIHSKQ